jgi:serine/threonine-protein kinase
LVTADTAIVVTLSAGAKQVKIINFVKEVKIPYQAPASSSSSISSSSSSDQSGSDSESSSSSSASSGPVPNNIIIYIEDRSHSINTVYRQFTITKDTPVELPFTVESGQSARYRIVRDGSTIDEQTVNP